MIWLYLVCARLLHNNKHRLKQLIVLCKIYKGQLEIDGNPYFIDQILEDQTNLHLLDWAHKVICLTLGPIILCFAQLKPQKENPKRHPHEGQRGERQVQSQLTWLEIHVYLI